MTIHEYLKSRERDVEKIFSSQKVLLDSKQVEELFQHIVTLRDGMFDLAEFFQDRFGVSQQLAELLEEAFMDSIVSPRFAEFLKLNETLVSGKQTLPTATVGSQARPAVGGVHVTQEPKAGQRAHATFYFSTEDEEEIKKIAASGNLDSTNSREMELVYSRVAGEVVQKSLVNSSTTANQHVGGDPQRKEKRLENIIVSYLKDTRDGVETKEALKRSWKVGGVELDLEQAERILQEAQKAKKALREELAFLREVTGKRNDTSVSNNRPDSRYDNVETSQGGVQDLSIPEIAAPTKESSQKTNTSLSREMKPFAGSVSHDADQKGSVVVQTQTYPSQSLGSKPAVDSVGSSSPSVFAKLKTMGPIEELASMTLDDFRKLGSVLDAVRKINDKVELLAADSLLEKKKGIDAWKQSDVYKLYMRMGMESLEKRVGVGEVAGARQSRNLQSLSAEEFAAIADLNRKISFSN